MKAKGFLAIALLVGSSLAVADDVPTFELTIQDHEFQPAELSVPANQKVKLLVKNLDATPEEFESHELDREKLILAGQQGVIYIGPLNPGWYPFYGEFNEDTAQGVIHAQ